MNKKILQKINNLAKFIFDESEFNKLNKLLLNEQWNDVRLFVDDKLDDLEYQSHLDNTNDELLSQYKKCDELLDVVLEFYIKESVDGEGEQVR